MKRALFSAVMLCTACHHDPTDARGVRANLMAAGYALTASTSPDPNAAAYPTVVSSECFDAAKSATVHVCVWVWPSSDDLRDRLPLETFTQDHDAYTESRGPLFVVVTPTGGPGTTTPGYRAIKAAWGG